MGGSYLNIQSVFPPSIVVMDSPSGGTRLINNDKRRKNNSLEEMRNLPARGNQGERDDKSCYRFLDDRPLFLYYYYYFFESHATIFQRGPPREESSALPP